MTLMQRHVAPEFFVELEARDVAGSGRGIFVLEPVAAGRAVLAFGGPLLTRSEYLARSEIDHCIQIGVETFLGPSGDLDDLTNHSCDPTTRIEVARASERALMIAHVDLAPGTEVTFDYSSVQLEDPRFRLPECLCGASSCRGSVGDFTLLCWQEKSRLVERGLSIYYVTEFYRQEALSRALKNRERLQR